MKKISLFELFKRFKWRISLTLTIALVEALLMILYPLFIGYAIDDLLQQNHQGLINLGLLGLASLLLGSVRRLYDTRVYAGIYRQVAPELVMKEHEKNSQLSTISARTSLLTEFVEFLENAMPELLGALLGIVGVLVIIASLDLQVFFACLALLILVVIVFGLSGKYHYDFNAGYNNELEQQVKVLELAKLPPIMGHFRKLMAWNIKLSDLETFNYFIVFLGVLALFLYTPVAVIGAGVLKYGLVFSILMYVFDFIEAVLGSPLFIQQIIRLKEISQRLSD